MRAIEPVPVVQPKKSRLASLRAQFNAGIKRLKKAITIEDVETQRIVVKELFAIFRLILIAVGIGALIKYGVPYIGEQIDIRTAAFTKALDKRTAALLGAVDARTAKMLEAIDLRIKTLGEAFDVRGNELFQEITSQRNALLKAIDARANIMLQVADIRAKKVTKGVDIRTAALLKALNKQTAELTEQIEKKFLGIMQKIHGTELRGLGVSARINIPSVAPVPAELPLKQQPQPEEFEYTGRF